MASRSRHEHPGMFCSSPAPDRASLPAGPAPSRAAEVDKKLVIAQLNSIKGYGPWSFASTPGGGASLAEIHTMGLTSEDNTWKSSPGSPPSFPRSTTARSSMLPDGRMQTTWKLRPDVKWHNGVRHAPLTMSSSAGRSRAGPRPLVDRARDRRAESVQALDPLTAAVTWRTTFYRALELSHRDLWPYPSTSWAKRSRATSSAFLAHPYFTDATTWGSARSAWSTSASARTRSSSGSTTSSSAAQR